MKSIFAAVILFASAGLALAQTDSTTTDTETTNPRLGKTPSDNAKPGAVAERSPGTWISAARARHSELIGDRVREDNRNTENSATANTNAGTTTGTTGTTGSTSTDALSGLLGGLLSDPSALSGLTGLLGSGGGLSGLLGGTSKVRSDAEESVDVMSLAGWGDMLASFSATGFSGMKTYLPKNATSQVRQYSTVELSAANEDGAAFTTDEKTDQRSQTTTPTTTETKFWKRLANSLLTTTFTALAAGLTSANAINLFKDFLRPIFDGGETDNSDDGSNGNGNSNDNDNGSQVRAPAGQWRMPALA